MIYRLLLLPPQALLLSRYNSYKVRRCGFFNNLIKPGGSDGGAIYIQSGSVVTLELVVFSGNSAQIVGADIYVEVPTNGLTS